MPDEKTLKGKFTYRANFWGNDYADCVEYEPGSGETFDGFWSVAASKEYSNEKGLAEHENFKKQGELAIRRAKIEKKIDEVPLQRGCFYIMIDWMDPKVKRLALTQSKVHPEAKYKIRTHNGRNVYGFWPKEGYRPEPEPKVETDEKLDRLCEELGKGVWCNKKLGDTTGIWDFSKWYRKDDCILLFPTRTAFNKAISDVAKKLYERIPAKRQKIDQAEDAFKVIENKIGLEKAIFTASNWEKIPGRSGQVPDDGGRIRYVDNYFRYVGML